MTVRRTSRVVGLFLAVALVSAAASKVVFPPPRPSGRAMTVRRTSRVVGLFLAVALVSAPGCMGGAEGGPDPRARPLPPPVMVRPEPDGVTLADPAFKALPGATADFGRLGGAVYQIEVPDRWNGRL